MFKRVAIASATVVVAAATGIVTNVLSSSWTLTWWLALGVLVVLGVGLQLLVGKKSIVSSTGPGAVGVGGSTSKRVTTRVRGKHGSGEVDGEISAAGPGSVAIGGNADGEISTDVS